MKARLMTLLLVLALAAFTAAGCGDDEDGGGDTGANAPAETTAESVPTETETDTGASGSGGGTELKISADPGGALAFDKESLEATAGEVTIVMDNPSTLPHAVEIEGGGPDAEGETVQQGGKSEATAELEAGEYEYFCPVPGHREGGMTGTLTVK